MLDVIMTKEHICITTFFSLHLYARRREEEEEEEKVSFFFVVVVTTRMHTNDTTMKLRILFLSLLILSFRSFHLV